jgi:hypothetical protein
MAKLLASPFGRRVLNETGNFGVGLLRFGFPAAGIEVNRRARLAGIHPEVSSALRFGTGWAWAARGRWDTALTMVQEVANEHPGILGPPKYTDPSVSGIVVAIESYSLAVLGAWLGATPPAFADQRRSGALAAISLLSDEESRQDARGRVAWLDGLLGLARGDRRAIQTARRDADRSGYVQAKRVDRSLAAFERGLMGDWKRAGRELSALEDMCMENLRCNHFTPQTAVQRLVAAQWLLRVGEVEEASRLLRRQNAAPDWVGLQWTANYAVGAPAYLILARVEEARKEPGLAREYYQRFLRLYDQPMPSQIQLVEEAQAALARLEASRSR